MAHIQLSIVVPVYNEVTLIEKSLPAIISLPINKEVIVIDDASSDGTEEKLKNLYQSHDFKLIRLHNNSGKGAAVRRGLADASGEYFIICDADLEYNPDNIINLLKEAQTISDQPQAVYGSRFKTRRPFNIYYLFNIFITWFFNLLFHTELTDSETCFKMIPTADLKKITLKSKGFEIDLEITAQLIKYGYKIKEVPIDYWPRKISEGKKIKIIDGFKAIAMVIRQRIVIKTNFFYLPLYLLISSLFLLWPALYNGYPFYFYDDASYIVSAFTLQTSPYKPITYGFFINFFLYWQSLWPIALAQALIINYALWRVVQTIFVNKPYLYHILILIILSFFTSLSWFTGLIMPDILLGAGALCAFSILHKKSHKPTLLLLTIIVFIAGISHTATPLIIGGAVIAMAPFYIGAAKTREYLNRAMWVAFILAVAVIFTMTSNKEHGYAYNHASSAFLMSRFNQIGILQSYLKDSCGSKKYFFCDFKNLRFPSDRFLWSPSSPLNTRGGNIGWSILKPEMDDIAKNILTNPRYLRLFLTDGFSTTGQLLLRYQLDSFNPFLDDNNARLIINHFFPKERKVLHASKQFNDRLWITHPVSVVSILASIISILYLIYIIISKKNKYPNSMALAYFCIVLLLTNALIMATFSSLSDNRYNTRLTWLLPLGALTVFLDTKKELI